MINRSDEEQMMKIQKLKLILSHLLTNKKVKEPKVVLRQNDKKASPLMPSSFICTKCGDEINGMDKIIVISRTPYWQDENHLFFCCVNHARTYIEHNILDPKAIFWFSTADDLEIEIEKYEFKKMSKENWKET